MTRPRPIRTGRRIEVPVWLWLLFGILAACAIAQVITEFKEYLK